MENNTNGPAKGGVSRYLRETRVEPYVGMPIYLDDSFFESIEGDIGIECPIQDDMDNMKPDNGQMKPDNGQMKPDNGQMKPDNGNGVMKPDMDTEMPMDCANGCPVGMAYVPWQPWEEIYNMEDAFTVGTVFPSLDLPFLGGASK